MPRTLSDEEYLKLLVSTQQGYKLCLTALWDQDDATSGQYFRNLVLNEWADNDGVRGKTSREAMLIGANVMRQQSIVNDC